MIKKLFITSIVFLATINLSACGSSSCSTEADVQAKAEEMTKKFEDLMKSGDMSKIMGLTGKMQSISKLSGSSNPQAACDAMDELMDDL